MSGIPIDRGTDRLMHRMMGDSVHGNGWTANQREAVLGDLQRMYGNYKDGEGPIDSTVLRNARRSGAHGERVSLALQNLEEDAGRRGRFDITARADELQQTYERRVNNNRLDHGKGTIDSQDYDGRQEYGTVRSWDRESVGMRPTLAFNEAAAERAAAHVPTDRYNAAEASAYMQDREMEAVDRAAYAPRAYREQAFKSADRIDMRQENYEWGTGIDNRRFSQDIDGKFYSTADHARAARDSYYPRDYDRIARDSGASRELLQGAMMLALFYGISR